MAEKYIRVALRGSRVGVMEAIQDWDRAHRAEHRAARRAALRSGGNPLR